MDKFKNKYRIESARLKNWDYGSNGAYFITICTANRAHYFGDVQNEIMCLNEIGILAENYWAEIPKHFPFVELGNFVIMPNHVHGILIINKLSQSVGTRLIASLPSDTKKTGGITGDKNPMLHENISRIIRWYKGRCTYEMRKINTDFIWQSRFHDHIIRTNDSFMRIQNYISDNPYSWGKDKYNG